MELSQNNEIQPIVILQEAYEVIQIYLNNQDPILDVRKGWLYSLNGKVFTIVKGVNNIYEEIELV